ncbi:MAG: hypothetical protein ABW198_06600 [Pseudorhodoplanes sp.]
MNARSIIIVVAQGGLALFMTQVDAKAQSSELLPIEVKCPAEGGQTYAQTFRRFDGLTIKYLIKYGDGTPIAVSAEVESDSVFRIVDEIDLLSAEATDEKKALAKAVISKNQPAFDAVCRGSAVEKGQYEQRLQENVRLLGSRP